MVAVGDNVPSLRTRAALLFVSPRSRTQISFVFETLHLDTEPVSAIVRALRASSGSLRHLRLTASTCVLLHRATDEELHDFEGCVLALQGPVHVTVTCNATDLLLDNPPKYGRYVLQDALPSMPTKVSDIILRAARHFLLGTGVAYVSLPPIILFDSNELTLLSTWDLYDFVFSDARLRLSYVALDIEFYDDQHLDVEDPQEGMAPEFETVDEMEDRLDSLMVLLTHHPIPTLCLLAGSFGGFYVEEHLPSLQAACLRLVEDEGMDSLSDGIVHFIVPNKHIRSVEVYFVLNQGCQCFLLDRDSDFLATLFSREFVDGVRLSALLPSLHRAPPVVTSLMDDQLRLFKVAT